jgi:hypothetical protein
MFFSVKDHGHRCFIWIIIFFDRAFEYAHVKWVHCHHGVACPWVADRDSLQTWRVAANILNKQSRTADSEWSSSLGVWQRANNASLENSVFVTKHFTQPWAGCCECGDEPSGSCATEWVSLNFWIGWYLEILRLCWDKCSTTSCRIL